MVAVHNFGDCLWLWARIWTGFLCVLGLELWGRKNRGQFWFIKLWWVTTKNGRIDNIREIWISRGRTKRLLRIFESFVKANWPYKIKKNKKKKNKKKLRNVHISTTSWLSIYLRHTLWCQKALCPYGNLIVTMNAIEILDFSFVKNTQKYRLNYKVLCNLLIAFVFN